MKKRLLAFVAALLIMVGLSVLQQAINSTPTVPEAPGVVIAPPDDGGQTPGGTEQEGNVTPEDAKPGDATNPQADPSPTPTNPDGEEKDPASTGHAENAPPNGQDSSDGTNTLDLGPDIELGEGITDARAEQAAAAANVTVRKDGTYTSKVEVALYIHTYGRVPSNFISKTKARNAGWVNTEGNLWDVLPGMSIGGGGYTNEQWGDEPLLPETPEGRDWRECDINYQGGYRGAERLVYSDDGLVFYTGDHYSTFERLY